ncbi:MAG: response regulator [Oligoflexia bacterium]|nr:response regulator [Oligoflexia bacterium]MBF0366377.1 response regulator [Oligoflexia bacterium]
MNEDLKTSELFTTGAYRILIAEDTPVQLKRLKFYLEKNNYYVRCACNGKEAFDELDKDVFDIVITDVQMPVMDGIELLEKIRGDERKKHLPVMIMTTMDTDEMSLNARFLGADDFVAKPFIPRELYFRIKNIVEKRKMERLVRLQLLALESSMDGVAILNHRGEFIYLNENQIKSLGFAGAREVLNSNWKRLVTDEEQMRLQNEIMPRFEHEGKWIGEMCFKRRDGQVYEQEVSLSKIDDKGQFVSVCRDISERKRAYREKEELQQKLSDTSRMSSVAGLAAGVSVKMDIALESIEQNVTQLESLARESNPDHTLGMGIVDKLDRDVELLVHVVDALRSYSKMGTGDANEKMDVHKVVLEITHLLASAYQAHDIHISSRLEASKMLIRGSSSYLAQVLVGIFERIRIIKRAGATLEIIVRSYCVGGSICLEIFDDQDLLKQVDDAYFTLSQALIEDIGGKLLCPQGESRVEIKFPLL